MTQRIFDIKNEKDMQDLWNILPEKIERIVKDETSEGNPYNRYYTKDYCYGGCAFIKINWHDKTEIIRSVNYEKMIGCVCKFSTCPIRIGGYFVGILDKADNDVTPTFHMMGGGWFEYCEPAKKSELKFWGE